MRNLDGGAVRDALEQHMFQKMRHAVLMRLLVAGAALDPEAEGDRLHSWHRLHHDSDTIGQSRLHQVHHRAVYPSLALFACPTAFAG
jgi:hypothetical protein